MNTPEDRLVSDREDAPKIFVFCNGGEGTDWVSMSALSEDGEFLAGHACSHINWGPHDMGFAEDNWKHEQYSKRYPGGFRLVWVSGNPTKHEGLMAAHAKHVAAGELGTPWQREQKALADARASRDAEWANAFHAFDFLESEADMTPEALREVMVAMAKFHEVNEANARAAGVDAGLDLAASIADDEPHAEAIRALKGTT